MFAVKAIATDSQKKSPIDDAPMGDRGKTNLCHMFA